MKLGYSPDEIILHLLNCFHALFYGVLTVLSAIIMFNFNKDKSLLFHVILGILMSVIIYYMNFIFSSLGNNGRIPCIFQFLPMFFFLISTID